MVKALKRRFVLITVLVSFCVLAAIMLTLNISNYTDMNNNADNMVEMIYENDGEFPLIQEHMQGKPPPDANLFGVIMGAEMKMQTRFFTAEIKDGEIVSINTKNIASISNDEAKQYALGISETQGSGTVDSFRYGAYSDGDTTMLIFLEYGREIVMYEQSLNTSIIISVIAIIAVFFLAWLFADRAVKPIAESYNKQKQFITDASHELKTPLTVISANMELIEMTEGESKWTTRTKEQVAKLTKLTNELVFLSRMDEEGTTPQMTTFDLTDTAKGHSEIYVDASSRKGLSYAESIEENIELYGNEEDISKLMGILLDNAVKYTDENGRIEFFLHKSGSKIQLGTKNTCAGLPAGKHNELFERFYRADESRNVKTGGYGIGLSIAGAIVKAHRGKIKAVSDGSELTITVEIP